MRMLSLLRGDIRVQYRYGFYYLYAFLAVLYIGLLSAFPEGWKDEAALLMIFSDPAAMGLYFMGAIVLFEKSERVLDSLAVSPVGTLAYTLSKLTSIGMISMVVGVAIGWFSHAVDLTMSFIAGIFVCSCLFSAVGLVLAAGSFSLNSFILATVPAQLGITIPAVLWLLGWRPPWLLIHPGASLMALCEGHHPLPPFIILACWTTLAAVRANRAVRGMFRETGGIRL